MKIRTIRLCFLVALSLLCCNPAHADYMNWSYTSTPSVPGVSVGSQSPGGGAAVTLTDFTNQAGGTSIPIIAYVTNTAVTSPLTFNPSSSTYTLKLAITDNATHDTGTMTFTGAVGGTLSATSSTLTNSFAPSPNSLTLDGHVYKVTLPPVALAPPTAPQQNIMATVSVSNASGGGVFTPQPPPPQVHPPTSSTPEPSSVILACGAMAFMALKGVRQSLMRSIVG